MSGAPKKQKRTRPLVRRLVYECALCEQRFRDTPASMRRSRARLREMQGRLPPGTKFNRICDDCFRHLPTEHYERWQRRSEEVGAEQATEELGLTYPVTDFTITVTARQFRTTVEVSESVRVERAVPLPRDEDLRRWILVQLAWLHKAACGAADSLGLPTPGSRDIPIPPIDPSGG